MKAVWPTRIHIAVDENLVSQAESLAWDYTLRGCDAIHLASALTWQEGIEHEVVLARFDRKLWEAAQGAGMAVWPEQLQ
jgi:hypothetical protein